MKILVNGGLNLSALDGWWAEAFSKRCGWALDASTPESDATDTEQLYTLLETAGGHVYEAIVATSRQSGDFTVRVIPAHADALVPAELPLISWQR